MFDLPQLRSDELKSFDIKTDPQTQKRRQVGACGGLPAQYFEIFFKYSIFCLIIIIQLIVITNIIREIGVSTRSFTFCHILNA
jgi:hypothetical protein